MSDFRRSQCGCGLSPTMLSRRVGFDDYHCRFWVESRVEALQRQCATRLPDVQVLNKYHDKRYELLEKQLEAARRKFYKRNVIIFNKHKQNLMEHVCFRRVLNQMERENIRAKSDSNITRKDKNMGICKVDVQQQIDERKKEFCPTFRRLILAKKHLEAERGQEKPVAKKSASTEVSQIKRVPLCLAKPKSNRHLLCTVSAF